MASKKRMDQIRNILRNYVSSGYNVKVTSRVLGISKNTVKEYVRRAQQSYSDIREVLSLDDDLFHKLMYKEDVRKSDNRQKEFEEQCAGWLVELGKVGVTRSLLWAEYRQDKPDGYGYSQFCEYLRQYANRQNLTLTLEHRAGEVLMVDFAGKKMSWIDRSTGEKHDCEVLVTVLPFSQYSFCIALPGSIPISV
jgi:transposase